MELTQQPGGKQEYDRKLKGRLYRVWMRTIDGIGCILSADQPFPDLYFYILKSVKSSQTYTVIDMQTWISSGFPILSPYFSQT